MNYKEAYLKQKELSEHLKAYYDAQNSPAVKLIQPQWDNRLEQLESELSFIEGEEDNQHDINPYDINSVRKIRNNS